MSIFLGTCQSIESTTWYIGKNYKIILYPSINLKLHKRLGCAVKRDWFSLENLKKKPSKAMTIISYEIILNVI